MTMRQVASSIVGPTSSGKTTFIDEIELFDETNTPTGRRILIHGRPVSSEFRYHPTQDPITLVTQ